MAGHFLKTNSSRKGRGVKVLKNLGKNKKFLGHPEYMYLYIYVTVTAYLLTVVWYKNHRQSKQDETPEKLTVWV